MGQKVLTTVNQGMTFSSDLLLETIIINININYLYEVLLDYDQLILYDRVF